MNDSSVLIAIDDLSIGFSGRNGQTLPVLRNIDLQIRAGESLGLVGESGSGKSTLALAAMGYLKRGLRVLNGSAHFKQQAMFDLDNPTLQRLRGGRIALIPQNAGQSLTPTSRIGQQLLETLKLHSDLPEPKHAARVIELLSQVRLPAPDSIISRYPHELSGGQQQRVAIAMALAGEPEALLLDEPTTGLDVTTQAHILELLRELAQSQGLAMVYVSHDLGVIARVADRVAVMYAGEIILEGPTRAVLSQPTHPYAAGLIASIPKLSDTGLPQALDGHPPAPGVTPNGCTFAERCQWRQPLCTEQRPEARQLEDGESIRCHYPLASTTYNKGKITQNVRTSDNEPEIEANTSSALQLQQLAIRYRRPSLWQRLRGEQDQTPATVDGIDLDLQVGETLGLVGESGSGKSTILKAIAGLLDPAGGKVLDAKGQSLPALSLRDPSQLRRIQLIFQNPDDSLNPRHTVSDILSQPLTLYFGLTGQELYQRIGELLSSVRLGEHYRDRLPSQLSGGEKQRVAVARAFAAEPQLILCDEITSALDVSVQAAVLELLKALQEQQKTAYVFVSHDLAVVRALSDRVAVLYQGRLCEVGGTDAVYALPSHPYTEVLLDAVLQPDPDIAPRLSADDVVELNPPAKGCPFQRRCPRRLDDICDTTQPPWQYSEVTEAAKHPHGIRCHIPLQKLLLLQCGERIE